MLSRPIISGNVNKIHALANARSALAGAIPTLVKAADVRQYHEVVGDTLCPSQVMGIDHIRDPRLNKGLAFTLEERQTLGIHGLQPARFKTQEEQLQLCKIAVERYSEPLNKYLYLVDLQDRNERLFYRFLTENIHTLMPIVYTPTVGLACQRFGLIYRRPRGLFITINDRHHVFDVLKNWPESDVRTICVTDGERILGLGDLGAHGMGIPVGKLALCTALAAVRPHQCLPLLVDVGTNNKMLLDDPLYVGLRQKRVAGEEFNEFMDEFMEAVVRRYGATTLVMFEDFGNTNAFELLGRYRECYCMFNDDIQGTAAVALGGIMVSKRLTGVELKDNTFLFVGAGEAALGIANLCVYSLEQSGVPLEEARSKIWMMDIDGLLTTSRTEGNLDGEKKHFAKDHSPMKNLEEIVAEVKPSILIGASAAGGIFTPKVLQTMAANNKRPIVFALSNPTSKAECTAEQAYENTEGRVIFSSGSPFPPVNINGKILTPGQGNNAYVFPGICLGITCSKAYHVPEEVFHIAAKTVAEFVNDEGLNNGSVYPPLDRIREISLQIAIKVAHYAYSQGLATGPEPQDMREFIVGHQYDFNYKSAMPITWPWPEPSMQPKNEINKESLFKK